MTRAPVRCSTVAGVADGRWWRRLPPRSVAVAGLVAGLALAAAGTGSGGFLVGDGRREPFRRVLLEDRYRTRRVQPPGELPEVLDRIAHWLELGIQVLVALLLLLALAYGVRQLFRALTRIRRLRAERSQGMVLPDDWEPGESTADDASEELRRRVSRELDLAAEDVGTAADPREVVIACYARMEAAAAAAGTPRRPHETPAELVARLLEEQQVPEPAVRRLTELFEQARFSHHPVDETMRQAARESLDAVRNAMGAPA